MICDIVDVWLQAVQWLWLAALLLGVSAQESSAPQEVEVIKQINRVNDDGSYTFGYEAADGSFKIETRDVLGNVKGMFGFVDENGELKRVSYTANNGTGFKASGNIANERAGLPEYTTVAPGLEPTRRPVLVLRQPVDPTRPPSIQHIPRRGPTSGASSTTPVYGEYIRSRRPLVVLPTQSAGEVTSTTPKVTEEPETDTPTHFPLGKVLITKRPLGRGGNNLRRQLGNEPDSPSGDVSDVYTGGAAIPRYNPIQSFRSPQSSLLANLPPHVAAAVRQQQIARATAAARPYPVGIDSYPEPIPSPRPAVLDDQEYPREGRTTIAPVRAFYRPPDDGPVQVPFPMTSLRSLRDELLDYIMQYLQFRLQGGSPYMPNPYSTPFQNPYINPNIPYQNAVNYGGGNPNLFNPYLYPTPPFSRNPYQPPFGPLGYPPTGYPPVGYPGQGFPQPLPFTSPNKQQAAQQYGPTQRSAPTYEQFTPSQRQNYEQFTPSQRQNYEKFTPSQRQNYEQFTPSQVQSYEPQRTYESAAQRSEQVESRGSSDSSAYSLPPGDVLRMILARGLAGAQSTTSTSSPVRSVQILGAASSVSTTTARPSQRQARHNPPDPTVAPTTTTTTTEPADEMQMQA